MEFNMISEDKFFLNAANVIGAQLGIKLTDVGINVKVKTDLKGISIIKDEVGWVIGLSEKSYFLRALSLLVEKIENHDETDLLETPIYDSLGVMLDCSRNAVPHFQAFQKMLNQLALMGYTTVQLYMEDMYEVEGYPYFGYLRGRYSVGQLQQMDDYAASLGIELVPAIQTLAHFGQALKWNSFKDMVDVGDILLIDEPQTYELIRAIFKTLSQAFRSKKINIGMDEAHLVGLGKHLDKHGYQDRLQMMLRHFNEVLTLAREYEFTPMLWSDMFFRLASGGDYYNVDCEISPEIKQTIPDDVSLIYWDYYSEDKRLYDGMIKKHFEMSDQIIFAGGAWKWMGYQPNNYFSEVVGQLAHQSCKEHEISNVLLTAWGDNGGECSMFAILPTLQMWAEFCYRDQSVPAHVSKRLKTCTGVSYEDFMTLDLPMFTPCNPAPGKCSVNPPKYLMYQDVLCGLFDRHIDQVTYENHFRECVSVYETILNANVCGDYAYLFETQKVLCEFLAVKCGIGIAIRQAYQEKDREKLLQLKNEVLPDLIEKLDRFSVVYRRQWLKENKVFGLDIFDIRTGGLRQRILTAITRLGSYLMGEVDQLEELEEALLFFDGQEHDHTNLDISVPFWHDIQSASVIASI